MKKWTRARFQPNLPLDGNGYVTAGPAHRALAREAMALGLVTRAGLEVRARNGQFLSVAAKALKLFIT